MKKILIILNICLFILCGYLFFTIKQNEKEFIAGQYKSYDEILSACQSSSTSLSIMRKLYPNKVVYYDNKVLVCDDYNSEIPLSNYDVDLFDTNDNGLIIYKDWTIDTYLGVDVSHYSEDVDWAKVKADNISFAMLRLGYRGYQTGLINEDSYFESNYEGCKENDIKVGIYFFSQAVNELEAYDEAMFVLEHLNDKDIDYPVVYDFEIGNHENGRANNVTKEQCIKNTKKFLETIEAAGYTGMIYGGANYLLSMQDSYLLSNYDIWYAQYSDKPYYPYTFTIWQFTESGSVYGIKNKCDINISFKDYSKED